MNERYDVNSGFRISIEDFESPVGEEEDYRSLWIKMSLDQYSVDETANPIKQMLFWDQAVDMAKKILEWDERFRLAKEMDTTVGIVSEMRDTYSKIDEWGGKWMEKEEEK